MKKTGLLLTGLLAISTALTAQTTIEKRYDVTYSTGATYDTLNGAAKIPLAVDWDDDDSGPINIPFDFKYLNTIVNTVDVYTDGILSFNGLDVESISALNMDYESKGRGTIHYQTTGATGNRVFKIEFRNVGRYEDLDDNDSLNFQVWLHESDNAIEIRTGFSNVPDSAFATSFMDYVVGGKEPITCGVIINEGDYISENEDSIAIQAVRFNVQGALEDTLFTGQDLMDDESVFEYLIMGKFPPQGAIIRFAPKDVDTGTGIGNIDLNLAKIFPNPSKDGKYTIELKEQVADAHLTVFDMTGKKIHQVAINGDRTALDLSGLAAGQYIGQIKGTGKTGIFKLIRE